jgi:replication factor C subunit 2/4
LTSDAQAALRRVIEKYTKMTRFCIICNYISKIIDPLASRCAKFRFKPISNETHLLRLQFICEKENVELTRSAFECLIKIADGDLRKSITTLQSASKLYKGIVSEDNVKEVAAMVPDNVISGIYTQLHANYEGLVRFAEDVIHSGFQPDGIIFQLFDFIIGRDEISDNKKAKIVELLAAADYGLVAGGSEYLQILKTLTSIQKILKT